MRQECVSHQIFQRGGDFRQYGVYFFAMHRVPVHCLETCPFVVGAMTLERLAQATLLSHVTS